MKGIAVYIESTDYVLFRNSIIEIALVKFDEEYNRSVILHQFYNPETALIPKFSRRLGCKEDVFANTSRLTSDAECIQNTLLDADLICVYTSFDIETLETELSMSGYGVYSEVEQYIELPNVPKYPALICLDKLAREKFPKEQHSLDYLCTKLNLCEQNTVLTGSLLQANRIIDIYANLLQIDRCLG